MLRLVVISLGSAVLLSASACGGAAPVRIATEPGASSDSMVAPDGEWPSQSQLAERIGGQACASIGTLPDSTGHVFDPKVTWVAFSPGDRVIPDILDDGSAPSDRYAGTGQVTLEGPDLDPTSWSRSSGGSASRSISVPREVILVAQGELDRGAELRAGVRQGERPYALYFISLRPDGSAFVIGACPGSAVQMWSSAAAAESGLATEADAVRLVTDADDPAAAFKRLAHLAPATTTTVEEPLPNWFDQEPSAREWADAPLDVQAQVTQDRASISFPAEWTTGDFLICWRTELAWGLCGRPASADPMSATATVSLPVWYEERSDVSFWLRRSAPGYEGIVEIGTLTPADLDRWPVTGVVLTTASPSSAGSDVEQIAEDVRQGRYDLKVEEGPMPAAPDVSVYLGD